MCVPVRRNTLAGVARLWMWGLSSRLSLLILLMVPNLQATIKNSVRSQIKMEERMHLHVTASNLPVRPPFPGSCHGLQLIFYPPEVSHSLCSTPMFVAIGGACYVQQMPREAAWCWEEMTSRRPEVVWAQSCIATLADTLINTGEMKRGN